MGIPGPNDPDTAFPPDDAGGGGLALGNVCWFTASNNAPFADAPTVDLEWQVFDDGVPEFTDARVSPDDATLIEIQAAGTYMLTVEAVCATETPASLNLALDLNDGQGPLYVLSSHVKAPGDGAVATLRVMCPVQFSLNDTIKATVTGGAEDVSVTGCTFALVGLSTPQSEVVI